MELQFRVLYILRNIAKSNKDNAARVVETDLLDVLFAMRESKDDRIVNDKVNQRKHSSISSRFCCCRIEN